MVRSTISIPSVIKDTKVTPWWQHRDGPKRSFTQGNIMKTNNSTLAARYAKVISGIQLHLTTVTSLVLDGATYAPADLVKLFTSWAAAVALVTSTKAQWQAAVVAEHALSKTLQGVWLALQAYARNQYGQTPAVLADFGYTPRKTVEKDPETLVAAAAKNRATRLARHTLGSVQKKDITGATPAPAVPPPATAPVTKSS
jgi:hypothetical protein